MRVLELLEQLDKQTKHYRGEEEGVKEIINTLEEIVLVGSGINRVEVGMSWRPEVIADSDGKWCGNAIRFATKEEAEVYVADLKRRWTLVTDTRVVQCGDPVTNVLTKDGEGRWVMTEVRGGRV
jgi:hypothetical protein